VDDLRSAHQARRQQIPLVPEDRGTRVLAPQAASQSSIGKYTFEDDDGTQAARVAEWGAKEDRLLSATQRLNSKAVVFGERIDESNKRLGDMGDSVSFPSHISSSSMISLTLSRLHALGMIS